MLASCKQFILLLVYQLFRFWRYLKSIKIILRNLVIRRNKVEVLIDELQNSESITEYEQWKELAQEVDKLKGHDVWKRIDESPDYDYELIAQRLQRLKELELEDNVQSMAWTLRGELHRNLGGICNPAVYQPYVGTKVLIEEYVSQVCKLCTRIRDHKGMSTSDKYCFFRDTSYAYGRTALLLSGGGSLGMYHLGVVKALFDQKLLPRVISGSSAGSLVAALIGTKTDAEIPGLFERGSIHLEAFEQLDNSKHLLRKLRRLFSTGVLMDIEKLQQCVIENIGHVTFEEAYLRTGRVINITVASTKKHTMPSLLNYLTAPHVLIWSAACASCALPGVFNPVSLMAKDEHGNIVPYHPSGHKFRDGSFWADLPLQRLSELFNVNLFIVSQTNPHIIPFMTSEDKDKTKLYYKLKSLLLSEVRNRILQLYEFNVLGQRFDLFQAILCQKYEGDVTILPAVRWRDYLYMLSNPTEEYIARCINQGQRRTWPKISIIDNNCKVERVLDDCMRYIKRKHQEEEYCTHCGNAHLKRPILPPHRVMSRVRLEE
eukprot:GEZU01027036.1.p1 GENE.GEZU01027036.1~~GEZU01027036.1.p1  ORF type:complete len:545 (+),score=67.50 GEZU01027036.1:489-2123(+)